MKKLSLNAPLNNLKEMPPRAMVFAFGMIFLALVGLEIHYSSPEEKLLRNLRNTEVVAYNEHSVHTLGSGSYENPTFECWKSILPLEYPYNGLWLKQAVHQGVRAVSISYQNVGDRTEKKMGKLHYKPFEFDDGGNNSVDYKNGWTTEKYNLIEIK